jgi:hypothetical protein
MIGFPYTRTASQTAEAMRVELQRLGFTRLLVAGRVVRLDAESPLPEAETPFEVLVDRLVVQADRRARLLDSLEQALRFGQGMVVVHFGATASAQGRGDVKLRPLCPRSGRERGLLSWAALPTQSQGAQRPSPLSSPSGKGCARVRANARMRRHSRARG